MDDDELDAAGGGGRDQDRMPRYSAWLRQTRIRTNHDLRRYQLNGSTNMSHNISPAEIGTKTGGYNVPASLAKQPRSKIRDRPWTSPGRQSPYSGTMAARYATLAARCRAMKPMRGVDVGFLGHCITIAFVASSPLAHGSETGARCSFPSPAAAAR